MKDLKSILLALVSVFLLGTWVFHIYDKSKYANTDRLKPVIDTVAMNRAINDSVKKIYQATMNQMDTVQYQPDVQNVRLQEIDSLKQEIQQILDINSITKEDLQKAQKKIQYLQQQIDAIQRGTVTTPASTERRSGSVAAINEPRTTASAAGNNLLQAADIRFNAVQKENESDQLVISFSVKSGAVSFESTPVYLVVKNPSAQVVQDDEWLAGMFNTLSEGTMRFSRKLNVECARGEQKKVNASVNLSGAPSGRYQLLIYHNGQRIGQSSLMLN